MERDKRSRKSRLGETGEKKDISPEDLVVVMFNSHRPIDEFESFVQHHIEGGRQTFLFLALSPSDLDGAKKLAEFFRGEHGIVNVKEGSSINSPEAKGIVTLFIPSHSNINNPSAFEKTRGMFKRLFSRK